MAERTKIPERAIAGERTIPRERAIERESTLLPERTWFDVWQMRRIARVKHTFETIGAAAQVSQFVGENQNIRASH